MNPLDDIRARLEQLVDSVYREFQIRLTPSVAPESVMGIRVPELRRYAREIADTGTAQTFLGALPHAYYDENNLHALLICGMRDFDACLNAVETFLPFVDNWATCDMLVPRVFKKHEAEVLARAEGWMADAAHPYTVRFGVGALMRYGLRERFSSEQPARAAALCCDEYYINMMIAWYFATGLALRWDDFLPYIQARSLSPWVHNRAIQKAVESYRVSDEQKKYLKTLKVSIRTPS